MLTKDEEGSLLDEETGMGIITYDSQDSVIVIDKSLKGGNFTCLVQVTTSDGEIGYFPI